MKVVKSLIILVTYIINIWTPKKLRNQIRTEAFYLLPSSPQPQPRKKEEREWSLRKLCFKLANNQNMRSNYSDFLSIQSNTGITHQQFRFLTFFKEEALETSRTFFSVNFTILLCLETGWNWTEFEIWNLETLWLRGSMETRLMLWVITCVNKERTCRSPVQWG